MNPKKMLIKAEATALKQKRELEDYMAEIGGVEFVKAKTATGNIDAVTANLFAFYKAYSRIYDTCGKLIDNYDEITEAYADEIKGQTTIDDFLKEEETDAS